MFRRIFILLGLVAAFFTGVLVTRNWPTPPPQSPELEKPAPPVEAEKSPALVTEAPPAPLPPPPLETSLTADTTEYREIIDLLRGGYLESPALVGSPLTAETLPDVLEKARDKIRISLSATQGTPAGSKTLLEMLPGGTAYWRPRSFEPAELDRMVREWGLWKSAKPNGIIIDLRFFTDPNNFSGAAAAVGIFVTPGKNLFTVQGLNQPQRLYRSERQPLDIPAWMPLIILVNHQTRGAAETFTWAMRHHAGALLIGQPTAGEGGLFRETRLKSGRFLRLATARALAADGTDLMAGPLASDILTEIPVAEERTAFQAAFRSGAAALLAEPDPLPRLNQDINAQVLNAEAEKTADLPLADPVLKAAVDAATAIQVRRTPSANAAVR
jgi:C-terminal processing protease CtpA/Prc